MVEGKKGINFLKALLYLSPAIILMAIFTFYPLINTFIISFKLDYNDLTGASSGWGFANYVKVLSSAVYKTALVNTVIIAFVSVPLSIILSLLISVALNSIKPLQKFFQTVFFLPYVTNTIAIGMVFSVMFTSIDKGLVNTIINSLGGQSVNWLGGNNNGVTLLPNVFNPNNQVFSSQWFTSMLVLMFYIIWNSLPFKILILLSALQSIDKQYYQAAQIDGASKGRILTKITIPLLSPQIFYLLITSFIGAFKEYTSVVAIFGDQAQPVGGRHNIATVVWFIYDKMGDASIGAMGLASAGAVILFVIILVLTLFNNLVAKKKVHY